MTALVDLYGITHVDLLRWVRQEFGLGGADAKVTNPHKLRREEISQRVRLYRDEGRIDFEQLIDDVYQDKMYKLELKKLIGVASQQNVSRRVIDEVASLYDKPAVRTLRDRDAAFHAEEKRLNLHEIMQERQRLITLCNEVLVWQFTGADAATKLRVVTPDFFDVVSHPADVTVMAGLLIDARPVKIGLFDADRMRRFPHFELWDDTYRYLLSADGDWVDELGNPIAAPIEHGLGRIPGVLLHRREPLDRPLDNRSGRDIVSGHLATFLLSMMIMRLAKSQGENQPVLQGNLANVAAQQPMNGESPIVLPPEVVASVLATKTDPGHYLSAKKEVLTSLAQTYGMSYEQLTYQETNVSTSGKAYTVRREKLTELRTEQRRRALIDEAQVISLMGFDPDGVKIDHTEQAIPQDATEEVALLDLKMRLGLDSPIRYLKRKDPDLDDDGAHKFQKSCLADYAVLIEMVRRLNLPANASVANPGNDPQINGGNRIVEKISTAALLGLGPNPAPGASAQTNPAMGTATAA